MPTARVGAMPPTPAFNDQHGHGHGAVNKKSSKERRKQKGITMEVREQAIRVCQNTTRTVESVVAATLCKQLEETTIMKRNIH